MTTLEEAAALARNERGLVIVATLRGDGTIQSSLVNAGIVPHPATAESTLAFVTNGPVKLANLRARPQLTATFRNGWQWAAVEGHAELAGPDDTTTSPTRTTSCRRSSTTKAETIVKHYRKALGNVTCAPSARELPTRGLHG